MIMKKLVYLIILAILFSSCVKDDEKPPNTDNLPKRINTIRVYEHNVETKRVLYTYSFNEIVKAQFFNRTGQAEDWEMINELNYRYNLPKVTITVNYNLLGTWTPTAKIEYIIEDGHIRQMDDYTYFYDTWRHDVSSVYTYSNNALISYLRETLNADTVSYSTKQEYEYSGNQIEKSIISNLVDGNWELYEYYKYDYSSGLAEIEGYQSDSTQISRIINTYVGDLITKKESYDLSQQGGDLTLSSSENFQYYNSKYLIYSDFQTSFLFQQLEYGYENAEGNASWFYNPQEIILGTPRPLKSTVVNRIIHIPFQVQNK